MATLAFVLVVVGSTSMVVQGIGRSRLEDRLAALAVLGGAKAAGSPAPVASFRRRLGGIGSPTGRRLRAVVCMAVGAAMGIRIAGVPGFILGCSVGGSAMRTIERRTVAARGLALERQLAELVDACGLAVRGGASVAQALGVAAREVDEPMASLVAGVASEQQLGSSFETALGHFTSALGSEDARLFALVMGIHHRSGGNIARPLDEVATTIRHRLAVRRELRALTAQGRISGAVLGILPIAFFLVLSTTSHQQLDPVYRSAAGGGMVILGLVMEGLAYLWIRQLLKVEV